MNPKKILILLEKDNNDLLLNVAISIIKNNNAKAYFLFVIEIPHKYPIEFEIGDQISIGENTLKYSNEYLNKNKLNYDINSSNFILLQSRNAGVALIKESLRIGVDLIAYIKNKKSEDYKYEFIKKNSKTNIIELLEIEK
tara:strand:+ start:2135 stop:2554 length:420 start_codon:yes stop_codon:yes gene_type:complete